MFGGVYLWGAAVLAAALLALGAAHLWPLRPARAVRRSAPESSEHNGGWLRRLDAALGALLCAILLQALPLPAAVVDAISPARSAFMAAVALDSPVRAPFAAISLAPAATLHAWLSLVCMALTFWSARAIFETGGIRIFSRVLAWGAIGIAAVAIAQHASGTPFVYGFWQPRDAGARPLGPFINRNHLGTWGLMTICLCAGYLQWREAPRTGNWRARLAAWTEPRRIVLQLAIVLLAVAIALAASRSSLLALACAGGYVAVAAPPGRRRRAPLAVLAAAAVISMVGYGDGQRLLLRIDETRSTGMANRVAIWRDTLPVIRDFPAAGVGAGAFQTAMRVYQTSPRTYYHNEAHNQYLQLAAEGGALLTIPAGAALAALLAAAGAQLRRRTDPRRWMRVAAAGGLVGVAIQSVWETGLTLPANGMLAAALAALLVHEPAPGPQASSPEQT